uniref:1-acylglycerol-3-phosphate O-acyltransferase n=1 Tax=Plectus sambesii TaxID=2011161 RepID=A0A914XNQ2_9BILA
MAYFWPKNCTVMLKKSLMYIPGFNFCALLCNAIFVDRFNRKNAIESCDLTLKEIKEKNVKVWIFPEGTRNTDDTFLPFKKGAFHLAQQAKIPIVPVVFSSYKPFYDKKNFKFVYGGKIIAEALPPIDSSKYADVTSLAEVTREKMLAVYPRLSAEAAERMRLATESKTK